MDLEDRGHRRAAGRGRLAARVAVPLVVFLFLIFIRTRGISQMFLLLGDQILYWRIALGSWRDLPIGGGPSSVGGTTLGPVFCWVLWTIRHLIGPWTDDLLLHWRRALAGRASAPVERPPRPADCRVCVLDVRPDARDLADISAAG